MFGRSILIAVLLIQVLCAAFFVSDIASTVLGIPFPPLEWVYVELIEVGAALGLIIGIVISAVALSRFRKRNIQVEAALRRAQSAFRDVLDERFVAWELTPAERDVALFAIKGFSTQEMAKMRGVSDGTIKAQTNAIYKKAGVNGRSQLLSLFIDELVEAEVPNQVKDSLQKSP